LNSATNTRRTVYAFVSRHDLDPILRLFNFPDPNITSDKRANTLVPVQELFTLNSPLMLKSAEGLAKRIVSDEGLTDDAARIRQAYRLALGRAPNWEEAALAQNFLKQAKAQEEELVAQVELPGESPAATTSSETPSGSGAAEEPGSSDSSDKEKKESAKPAKVEAPPKKLTAWEQFAHVLLSSNEFAFVE
jgi:hypothetical protein